MPSLDDKTVEVRTLFQCGNVHSSNHAHSKAFIQELKAQPLPQGKGSPIRARLAFGGLVSPLIAKTVAREPPRLANSPFPNMGRDPAEGEATASRYLRQQ